MKRRIPEVESATAPRNPWILGRVDDLRAADAAKPNDKGIRNGLRVNSGKLIGPEGLAVPRRIALNNVRLMDDKHSLDGRMVIAAMNDKYLFGTLVNAVGKF